MEVLVLRSESGTARPVRREDRAEVRNPVLALRAFRRFGSLHPDAVQALAELLHEIHVEAGVRAEHSWRTRKAPMAVYWRAVSVYAGHIRRALRRLQRGTPHQLDLIVEKAA
jgi:hypothetical protein